jgi:isocitrate/isopropylmalate dehydrogenase
MMLDYVGEAKAAQSIEGAVRTLLTSGKVKSLSAGVHPTSQIGDWIVEEVQKQR